MSPLELFLQDPLAPFKYSFMVEALIVGSFVGVVCAVLSCYLVLKGWSLVGDATSHAMLPGIVLAYVIGLPLGLGGFMAGLLCVISTGYIRSHSRVKEDTVLGVMFTGLFAFGLVLFTKVETDVHLMHILFGSLLGIPREQIIQTGVIGGLTLLAVLAMRKDLLLFCFDENHARTIGLNTKFLYYSLLSLLSLAIVVSLQAVGIILVIAMLITPGCTAYLLCHRFDRMLVLATTLAILACLLGVYVSFFINGATAACIVLTLGLELFLAMVFAPKRGLLARRYQARKSQAIRAS
ncbi:MAG: metal ABC transporter permease [Puniceicoccales bacterium]